MAKLLNMPSYHWKLDKTVCHPTNPSLENGYNTLGCIYSALLDYDESVRHFEAALGIFQKHHFDKSLVLTTINANLGCCCYRLEKLDRATHYLQHSLTILRSIYTENGDSHFQFAFPYDTLARVQCAQGFIEEAEYYCQKAFDLRTIELSLDDVDISLSFETFGIIHNAQM
ncbi:unnamed protein product, partial [Rotaria sp. Silwood2]